MRWTHRGQSQTLEGGAFRLGAHKARALREESIQSQYVLGLAFSLKSPSVPEMCEYVCSEHTYFCGNTAYCMILPPPFMQLSAALES